MKEYSVDRIEGEMVVLIHEDETRSLSLDILPKGLQEGDILLWDGVCYKIDNDLTAKRRQQVRELIDDLFV